MLLLVASASLREREVSEHVVDGLGDGLAAIDDEQDPPGRVESAGGEVGHQAGAHRGVLGRALDHAEGDLGAVERDPQRADQGMLAEPEAVQVHDQPALIAQRAGVQLDQPLGGRVDEPAGYRRLRRGLRGLVDLVADGFERDRVAAGGDPGEHARDDALGQQVGRRQRRVRLERHLASRVIVVGDGAHAGAAHRHAAAAKRDRAVLGAVPRRGAIGVVFALGASDRGDLGVHQLGHDLQPDGGRGGQQPFAHVLGEGGQVPVSTLETSVNGLESRNVSVDVSRGDVGVCDPAMGVLLRTWRSGGASHTSRSTRRTPTSTSTNPGSTSTPRPGNHH